MATPASSPFLCESCETFYPAAGDCTRCPDEPLMDTRDETVQHMIRGFDRQRYTRRAGVIMGVIILGLALTCVMVLGVVTVMVGDDVLEAVLSVPEPMLLITFGTVAVGLEKIGLKLFPPRQVSRLFSPQEEAIEGDATNGGFW